MTILLLLWRQVFTLKNIVILDAENAGMNLHEFFGAWNFPPYYACYIMPGVHWKAIKT